MQAPLLPELDNPARPQFFYYEHIDDLVDDAHDGVGAAYNCAHRREEAHEAL